MGVMRQFPPESGELYLKSRQVGPRTPIIAIPEMCFIQRDFTIRLLEIKAFGAISVFSLSLCLQLFLALKIFQES